MRRLNLRLPEPQSAPRTRLRERLIYLPGAVILLYGFWLTLTI